MRIKNNGTGSLTVNLIVLVGPQFRKDKKDGSDFDNETGNDRKRNADGNVKWCFGFLAENFGKTH